MRIHIVRASRYLSIAALPLLHPVPSLSQKLHRAELCICTHANARRDIGCGALLSHISRYTLSQTDRSRAAKVNLLQGALNKVDGSFGDGSNELSKVVDPYITPSLSLAPCSYTHYTTHTLVTFCTCFSRAILVSRLLLCPSRFVTAPLVCTRSRTRPIRHSGGAAIHSFSTHITYIISIPPQHVTVRQAVTGGSWWQQ